MILFGCAWPLSNVLHGLHFSGIEYLYVFSALAQSLAALVGLLGVFVVYRLQVQQSHIADLYREARAFQVSLDGRRIELTYQDSDARIKEWLKTFSSGSQNDRGSRLQRANDLHGQIISNEKRREDIKARFCWVGLAFLAAIGASLLAISMSDVEQSSKLTAGAFVLVAILFVWLGWFVVFCLREGDPKIVK